ncbi:MAG: peptide ABC transporter substrate-binding protein [Anaerolineales bacterium]|nr:peptide ABC transporter substrate-binding protein [Anaerolineales bacterium]
MTPHPRALARLALGLGLLLAACTAAPTAAPATEPTGAPVVQPTAAAAEGQGGAGGQIVLIIPEEPTSLNRYLGDAAIVRQVADTVSGTGLTYVDPAGQYQAALAAELPSAANGGLSEDLKTVTWHLKPDLKWSDGQPLTTADIVHTWETIANPDSGALAQTGGFAEITSIETPDDVTAIVTYAKPYPDYLGQFSAGLFPKHATGAPADMLGWEWNLKPVGAGPFRVTEWRAGESITLERNPYYYEVGKPSLDQIIFSIVPDEAAQEAIMQQGDAHVQLWPGADKATYDARMAGVASQKLVPGVWNLAIDFNLSAPNDGDTGAGTPHPILGDIRVRQAMAHAIDYDVLVDEVLGDQGVVHSTNPFAYGWYQCDLPRQQNYDVEAAKRLLEEAGWVEGPDGIRVAQGVVNAPDGTRLTLELQGYTNYDPLQLTEEWLAEQWKAVGIEITIVNYDFSIIFGSLSDGSPRKTGDFDMLIYDRSFTIEPQQEVSAYFLSTSIPGADNPDGDNYFRWVNPTADSLIAAAGGTFDQAERKQAYCALGEMVQTELPQLYLYVFQDGYGFSSRLSGYSVSTWGSMTWDIQNWQLAP